MGKIRLILSEEKNLNEIESDFILLKNTDGGVFGPEEHINKYINGKLEKVNNRNYTAKGKVVCFKNQNDELKSKNIVVVGIGKTEEISLNTIYRFYQDAFSYILNKTPFNQKIKLLSVIHGIGFGLEKESIFYQLINALQLSINSISENNIDTIIFNENGMFGQAKILSFLIQIKLLNPQLVSFEADKIYLCFNNVNKKSISNSTFKDSIIEKIKKDNIIDSIQLLENNVQIKNQFGDNFILYQNWLNRIKNDEMKGLIGDNEKSTTKNKIILNLLKILDEYDA